MDKTCGYDVVLCDLDGVIWLAHEPIEGSADAVRGLKESGTRVMFVTNNSFSTLHDQVTELGRHGIDAEGNVLTSAMAAATVVDPEWRVLVCGGAGLQEEVSRVCRDVVVAHHHRGRLGEIDAVVVGMHREFDYTVLATALTAVHNGAVLIGSNADPTYPTPQGPSPGGGSILAAIATASGVDPVVTGKPYRPMAEMVMAHNPGVSGSSMLMVGDRADTDGAFASVLGCDFALVLSGVTPSAAGVPSRWAGDNLADVVRQFNETA